MAQGSVQAQNRTIEEWFQLVRAGSLKQPRFQRHDAWGRFDGRQSARDGPQGSASRCGPRTEGYRRARASRWERFRNSWNGDIDESGVSAIPEGQPTSEAAADGMTSAAQVNGSSSDDVVKRVEIERDTG